MDWLFSRPRRSLALVGALIVAAAVAAAAAPPASAGGRDAAIARAAANVKGHADRTKFGADQQVTARDVIVDANGTEHIRFDRSLRGLRVVGGDLVVHQTGSGALLGVSQTLSRVPNPSRSATLSNTDAIQTAVRNFDGTPSGARAESIVYARGIDATLAFEAIIEGTRADGSPAELHVVVDATYGTVLDVWSGIQTATGSGTGFFNGTVSLETTPLSTGGYRLTDPTRGNQFTCDMRNKQYSSCYYFDDADNIWGDGLLSNRQTGAVDAQYGTNETWDYYKAVFTRNGIANDGKGSYNRVHYGRKYNNAFWSDSCFCMTYGDGDGTTYNPFDSLDVAGHEMTHGVTSRTANLTYSGESGGLNEATSDIFGTFVEYFATNVNDAPDYKIGEKLYTSNPGETKALRYMWHPSLDGRSADCWYSGVGSLDVHYSSGPANHLVYLLAEGTASIGAGSNNQTSPTCNAGDTLSATGSGTLAGIGRSAAQSIWYRALTVYMTSSTNYSGARAATLSAAADLYGAGGTNYNAVAAAWSAINVI